jgi:hypothetical protein
MDGHEAARGVHQWQIPDDPSESDGRYLQRKRLVSLLFINTVINSCVDEPSIGLYNYNTQSRYTSSLTWWPSHTVV